MFTNKCLTKTKLLLVVITILLTTVLFSKSVLPDQPPDFQWVKSAGGYGYDASYGIARDMSNNYVITGRFYEITTFGSTTLHSAGEGDIFVAKYDPSGNIIWAKAAGGSSNDYGRKVAIDKWGDIFVTGYFYGTATFGSITLTSAGSSDIFIAKFDGSSGNILWARRCGGIEYDYGQDVETDGFDNIIVTGYFNGSATFESTTLSSFGSCDIFIAKYNSAGNLLWVRQGGGTGGDFGFGVEPDRDNNIIITGRFFDSATFGHIKLSSAGSQDIFIVKYDISGNVVWAKRAGGRSIDSGFGVTTDGSKNIVVTGYFQGSANFGSITLTSDGLTDVFIAKYDASGNIQWARKAGGSSIEQGNSITTDKFNNHIITGYFYNSATFGSTTLTSAGGYDVFVAKYSDAGDLLWAKQAGGMDTDYGNSLTCDLSANTILTGSFYNSAKFGSSNIYSNGSTDIFIAKLIETPSQIEVQYPNGGEVISVGTTCKIEWESDSYNGTVEIALSEDGGANWTNLTPYYPDNTGSYDFVFSSEHVSNNCLIKVTSIQNAFATDQSNSVFSIIDDKKHYIACHVPAGISEPTIDGSLNEDAWLHANPAQLLDRGGTPEDFLQTWLNFGDNKVSWKALWSSATDKIYIAIEIQDDVAGIIDNDYETLWQDDCVELYTDGDNNGGAYSSYLNAQQWQIRRDNAKHLLNLTGPYSGPAIHSAISAGSQGNWTLELEMTIYNQYPSSIRQLALSDVIGWDVWYDDSDNQHQENGSYARDHQVGWGYSGQAYKNADYFHKLELGPAIGRYFARKIPDHFPAPAIDGMLNEALWSMKAVAQDSLLFGDNWGQAWTTFSNNLVTWKAVWSDVTNKLYIAVNVQDDIRGTFDNNDPNQSPYKPWYDDSIEFYTDGNNDGGSYDGRYDIAQQWRVSGENKRNLNNYPSATHTDFYTGTDFVTAITTNPMNGNWTCEAEFTIYDNYPTVLKQLSLGTTVGWEMWYADSDNQNWTGWCYGSDHFTGWLFKGDASSNADYFGDLVLEKDLPFIALQAPNGGETWDIDTPQTIQWTSWDVTGNVKIEISLDGGSNWSIITSSTGNTGSFSWTPTAAYVSNNCLIKITSINDPAISDQSNSTFIISSDRVKLWIDTNLAANKSETIKIPVNSSDMTNYSVYSVGLIITYDATVIEAIDTDISGTILAASGWGPPTKNISTGKITLGMAGSSPLVGKGTLVKIIAHVIGNEGDSTILHFDHLILNEGDPAVTTSDGKLKVSPGLDIKGKLIYFSNTNIPVKNAVVQLSSAAVQSSISDANGNYEFLNLASANYTVTPQKSGDQKTAISAFDAAMVLRNYVNLVSLTPYQKIAADVSGNGSITPYDASWILQYSVGLIDSFMVGEDWTFVPHDYPVDDFNWAMSPRSRSYTPLNSDLSNQDFISILYGDVSGNWAGSNNNVSNVIVQLGIENIEQKNNNKWSVPIIVNCSGTIYSGSFKLLLNNSNLKFQSGSISNLSSGEIMLAANGDAGEISLAFASRQSLNNQPVKINLIFEGSKSQFPSAADFEFVDVTMDDKNTMVTVVKNDLSSEIPMDWELVQNYPNPFNPETSISYQVPKTSHVKIEVFNLLGQQIKTLVNEEKSPGTYQVNWNGMDEQGKAVVSGIYLYRMQSQSFNQMKRMILLR